MSVRRFALLVATANLLLGGCASVSEGLTGLSNGIADDVAAKDAALASAGGYPIPVAASADQVAWGAPAVIPVAVGDPDAPYVLDTGDRLRIFVYGQPNLSRMYTVDQEGKIAVPLIGNVVARGKTTNGLQATIKSRLGAEYVKDPQVTVDIQQNRPFFILGEVKTAGQYAYVSGMTVETAVAIAGGYTERASERSFRVTRRMNAGVDEMVVPGDFVLMPGDTVYVFERFF